MSLSSDKRSTDKMAHRGVFPGGGRKVEFFVKMTEIFPNFLYLVRIFFPGEEFLRRKKWESLPPSGIFVMILFSGEIC